MSTHAIFHQEQYVQAVERFASQHEHCGLSGRALHDLIWGRVVSIMQGRRAQARVTLMSAYYNEIDAEKAAWIRELIACGVVSPGEVDERSILQLPRQAQLADSGQTATGGTPATASTGQLNPEYSRWLMGLPIEFSNCADMAMQSMRKLRRSSLRRPLSQ
jgi:hypothetical protein